MFWFWFIILNKSYLGISYSSHSPLALACYRFSSLLSHFSFFQLLGHCSGRGMNQEYFRLTDWRILFSTRILWRKKNHLENVSFSETLSNIFSITALNFYIFLKIYFFLYSLTVTLDGSTSQKPRAVQCFPASHAQGEEQACAGSCPSPLASVPAQSAGSWHFSYSVIPTVWHFCPFLNCSAITLINS